MSHQLGYQALACSKTYFYTPDAVRLQCPRKVDLTKVIKHHATCAHVTSQGERNEENCSPHLPNLRSTAARDLGFRLSLLILLLDASFCVLDNITSSLVCQAPAEHSFRLLQARQHLPLQ